MRHPWSVPVLLILAPSRGMQPAFSPFRRRQKCGHSLAERSSHSCFPEAELAHAPSRDKGHVCAVWDGPAPAVEHRPA